MLTEPRQANFFTGAHEIINVDGRDLGQIHDMDTLANRTGKYQEQS